MTPKVIKRWVDAKATVHRESARISALVAEVRKQIEDTTGQRPGYYAVDADQPSGHITFFGRPDYGVWPTGVTRHWPGGLKHYEALAVRLAAVTSTDVEAHIVRGMDT